MYGRRNSQPTLLLVMFIALELILGFIPFTHWIDIGTIVHITLIHLPVVMAGALLGSGSGALVGLIAGVCRIAAVGLWGADPVVTPLFSVFTTYPDSGEIVRLGGLAARYPWVSVLTSLVPFIAAGLVAALLFRGLSRVFRGNLVSLALAGAGGSLVGALLMWLGLLANMGSLNSSFLRAFMVNTPLEALLAALACAIIGTPLYHRFVSDER